MKPNLALSRLHVVDARRLFCFCSTFLAAILLAKSVYGEVFDFVVPPQNQGINDGDLNGVRFIGNVNGLGTNTVSYIKVSCSITGNPFAFNGDFYATLVHMPSGKKVVLLNRVGKPEATFGLGYSDNGFQVVFDDNAPNGDIHSYQSKTNPPAGDPISGIWAPDGRDMDPRTVTTSDERSRLLNGFKGINPNGDWVLFVVDASSGGNGKLTRWGLDITLLGTNAPAGAPVITEPPQSQAIVLGSNASFTVSATGADPLSYLWFRNGESLINYDRISGVTNVTLSIKNSQAVDAGSYTVVVSDVNGSVTSSEAILEILTSPTITAQPKNQMVVAGQTANFQVVAAGSKPLQYQWIFEELVLPGATNDGLMITNARLDVAGSYSVVVSNQAGSVLSEAAQLAIMYALDVTNSLGGTVNWLPAQTSLIPLTVVELTAVPEPSFGFLGWSGALTGMTNPIMLIMDGNKSVAAQFAPLFVLITDVEGMGSIQRAPEGGSFVAGTVVQLTAAAVPGWQFIEWRGNASGSQNPIGVVLDTNREVRALFRQVFKLSTGVLGQGAIIANPAQTEFVDGSTVAIRAEPAVGYRFAGWAGDFSGTNNPGELVIDGNKVVTALFTPELRPIPNYVINEGNSFNFYVTGTNLQSSTATFILDPGAPAGAGINPTNGLFSWTPAETQGPSTNQITVRLSDTTTPTLDAVSTFTVVVQEINVAPVLTVPPDRIVDELSMLVVTNAASDVDIPANAFTYALVSGPEGLSLNATTGVLTWTPTEAQGPSTNRITVSVSDNGEPSLSTTGSFTVVVREINVAPTIAFVADQTVDELSTLMVTNRAYDADIPTNRLTFALVSSPSGMIIDSITGLLTWTPTKAQAPSTNWVAVSVSDDGVSSLSATNGFSVVVRQVAPPDPIRITDIMCDQNGLINIHWRSIPGKKYRLEIRNRMSDAAWIELREVVAGSESELASDQMNGQHERYYRIVQLD